MGADIGRRLGRLHRRGEGRGAASDGIELVPMRRRHVREVVAIEKELFPRPWSTALFLSELAQPATRRYVVALERGRVVGYAGLMVAAGEGHITQVAVAESHQRRKIATRLLLRLVEEALVLSADALMLEVRATNFGAQRLYRSFGFAPVGIRRNYYPEVNEDAIVMWAYDIDSPEYEARVAAIAAEVAASVRSDEPL